MRPQNINVRKLIGDKNPKLLKRLPRFVLKYLERILHQDEINDFLERKGHLKNQAFCEALVEYLEIDVKFQGMEKIPKEGPVIIVMNHPLGGVDGVAFIAALKEHRTDLVFLVNDLLLNVTPCKDLFVGVNKHGKNESSVRMSISEMFHSDKAICIFPFGMVSRVQNGKVVDLEWKRTFVTYARTTGHPVIPIHIEGRLSPFFYRLFKFRTFFGIKMNLEMLYLADELYKQRGNAISFTVGDPIYVSKLTNGQTEHEKAQEIKDILYQIPLQS
jgi:putative hemolysin